MLIHVKLIHYSIFSSESSKHITSFFLWSSTVNGIRSSKNEKSKKTCKVKEKKRIVFLNINFGNPENPDKEVEL